MGTTNPSNSVQTPGSNGGMPDESLQRALVTLNTQMATKATLATDPLTGKVAGITVVAYPATACICAIDRFVPRTASPFAPERS